MKTKKNRKALPVIEGRGNVFADFTNETQGQMEVAGVDPFRTRHSRAQQRQPKLEFRREADSDKETQHAICPPFGSALSGKERENAGMAVEAIA